MGDITRIFWTDHTHNGWWGCQEVSPGCDHCYARTLSERWNRAKWGDPNETVRWITSNANWRKPRVWNARAAAADRNWDGKLWLPPVRPNTDRRLVFAHSMSDLFEHAEQLDFARDRTWQLIEETPYLDWLLLTKRPQNIRRMIPREWLNRPLPNVWLGTTVEDQAHLDQRMFYLLQVPAAVHFVSAEPLIGPIDFGDYLIGRPRQGWPKIDWVITGGESGGHHRPLSIDWVHAIDAQCKDAGTAHFFKQVGGLHPEDGGCLLNGVEVKEFPHTNAPEPQSRAA